MNVNEITPANQSKPARIVWLYYTCHAENDAFEAVVNGVFASADRAIATARADLENPSIFFDREEVHLNSDGCAALIEEWDVTESSNGYAA